MILSGVSSRCTARDPIRRKSFGSFSVGLCGTGNWAADAAKAPNSEVLPDGLCSTTPAWTVISEAGTFHCAAAAATNISRAAAAARRSCIQEFAIEVEPPVP